MLMCAISDDDDDVSIRHRRSPLIPRESRPRVVDGKVTHENHIFSNVRLNNTHQSDQDHKHAHLNLSKMSPSPSRPILRILMIRAHASKHFFKRPSQCQGS